MKIDNIKEEKKKDNTTQTQRSLIEESTSNYTAKIISQIKDLFLLIKEQTPILYKKYKPTFKALILLVAYIYVFVVLIGLMKDTTIIFIYKGIDVKHVMNFLLYISLFLIMLLTKYRSVYKVLLIFLILQVLV